ncbi:S-transferase 1 [Seminavis robusta]|uniref:S-transferase 1 n=1 Tax=Seminavis robusta TaxID=568900 RepID=A0A9N8H4T5_9STRA|nr:S-transferase 1 [Seminavis robusta]|eukprot:Sro123_g059470.1 S-transferase 1 (273) ;mRNA; r:24473-25291
MASSAAANTLLSSSYYRFVYFNIRGAGEVCRLTLSLSGVPWEDVRYPISLASHGFSPGKEFRRDASTGAFDINMGSLPLLQIVGRDNNNNSNKTVVMETLGQSHSIAKFVATQHGLAGRDVLEQAKMDAIYENCRDVRAAWFRARRDKNGKAAWFSATGGNDDDRDQPKSLWEHCQRLEKAVVATDNSSDSRSPWCLGGPSPTLADVAIYHLLATPKPSVVTGSVASFFDGETDRVQQAYVDDCPRLAECVRALGEVPAIQEWEKKRPETFN